VGAPIEIALIEPEIPPNTGNVARLCACTGVRLHLVEPLGFSLDDRHLKRAGLDYWPLLRVQLHSDWQAFLQATEGRRRVALTTKASRTLWDFSFAAGDLLVFGPESRGLAKERIAQLETAVRIPMRSDRPVRSLNLSSAVAVACYEALRQLNAPLA